MAKAWTNTVAIDLLPVQTYFKTGVEVVVPGGQSGKSGRRLVGGVWSVIDIWPMR